MPLALATGLSVKRPSEELVGATRSGVGVIGSGVAGAAGSGVGSAYESMRIDTYERQFERKIVAIFRGTASEARAVGRKRTPSGRQVLPSSSIFIASGRRQERIGWACMMDHTMRSRGLLPQATVLLKNLFGCANHAQGGIETDYSVQFLPLIYRSIP